MQNFVKIRDMRYDVFFIFKMDIQNFLIFRFLVADQVRTTNVHRHTNFIKISQMVAEISYLTVVKMMAVCHRGFLKN